MIKAGKNEEALASYKKARSAYPDWVLFSERSFHHRGEMSLHAGKINEALTYFELTAKEYPESHLAYEGLAEAHLKAVTGSWRKNTVRSL